MKLNINKKYMKIIIILLIVLIAIFFIFQNILKNKKNNEQNILLDDKISLTIQEQEKIAQEQIEKQNQLDEEKDKLSQELADKMAKEQKESLEKQKKEEEEKRKNNINIENNIVKENTNKRYSLKIENFMNNEVSEFSFDGKYFDSVIIEDEVNSNVVYLLKDNIQYNLYICMPYNKFSSNDFKYQLENKDIYYTDIVNTEYDESVSMPYDKYIKYFIGIKEKNLCILLSESTPKDTEINYDILTILKYLEIDV